MRLLLVCILISSFTFAQQNDQQLAHQYYINGEYDKAISIYKDLNKERFSVAYYAPYFSSLLKTEQFKAAEQFRNNFGGILDHFGAQKATQNHTKKHCAF